MATTPALTWCTIELNASIFGGSVSTIKPFLREYFPSVLGRNSHSRSKTYNTGTNRYTYNTKTARSNGRLSKFDPLSSTVVVGGDEARDTKTARASSQDGIISFDNITVIDMEKGLQRKPSDGNSHEMADSKMSMGIVKTMEYSHSYETTDMEMISINLDHD